MYNYYTVPVPTLGIASNFLHNFNPTSPMQTFYILTYMDVNMFTLN